MVRKIFFYALVFFTVLFSAKVSAAPIDDVINANPQFAPAVVGISVKDLHSGATVYQLNSKILVHPASTLKVITSSAVVDYLGENYEFKTGIYKSGEKVYYKVGADPLFSYDDIVDIVSQYKSKNTGTIKKFSVDDTIIDKVPYGIGWQWDDNASIYFPQISPYIVNRNLFMVKTSIVNRNQVGITYAKEYKEKVKNELKLGDTTNVVSERDLFAKDSPIKLTGTAKGNEIIYIPALNPEQMYKNALMYTFMANDIPFNYIFTYEKLPHFAAQEAVVAHKIEDVLTRINANSDNLAAEVLVKHAGAAKVDGTGTTKDGLSVVRDFYSANGINVSDVIMVDGSGTSMNDYVTADFMTSALILISKKPFYNTIKNSMADFNKGSFKGRVSELNGKLKVKTGTLANTSAVVGYIKTNSGRDLAFAIMLDNLPDKVNAKDFEDAIIRAIARQ